MKKTLLATSALVSMSIAAPAMAMDGGEVNFNVWQEFGYSAVSDELDGVTDPATDAPFSDRSSMYSDGEIAFVFENTSDSGLNYQAYVEIEANPEGAPNGIDEASMSISTADVGTVTLGANDDVSTTYATFMPGGRNRAIDDDWVVPMRNGLGEGIFGQNSLDYHADGADYSDNNAISYRSPSLGGFEFGATYAIRSNHEPQSGNASTGDNADIAYGVKYQNTFGRGIDFGVQASVRSNGEEEANEYNSQAYGVNVGFHKFKFAAAIQNIEDANAPNRVLENDGTTTAGTARSDTNITGYGVSYDISDNFQLSAGVVAAKDDLSGNKLDTTTFGLSYTIAPGLNFALASNKLDFENASDTDDNAISMTTDEIRASIQANF